MTTNFLLIFLVRSLFNVNNLCGSFSRAYHYNSDHSLPPMDYTQINTVY